LTCHVWITTSPVGSTRAHAVSLGKSKPRDFAKSGGPGAISTNDEKADTEIVALVARLLLRGSKLVDPRQPDRVLEAFLDRHTVMLTPVIMRVG